MGFRAEIAHNCSITAAMYLQRSQKHRGQTTKLLQWKKQRPPNNEWVFQIHIYMELSYLFSFQTQSKWLSGPKEPLLKKNKKNTTSTQVNLTPITATCGTCWTNWTDWRRKEIKFSDGEKMNRLINILSSGVLKVKKKKKNAATWTKTKSHKFIEINRKRHFFFSFPFAMVTTSTTGAAASAGLSQGF